MKLLVLSLVGSLLIALSLTSFRDFGAAHADGSAMLDAGAGSGSAVAAPTPPVLHDPTTDPAGFISQMVELWHNGGWSVALMLGVIGLLELVAWAGKTKPSLAWIGKGRTSIVIGAATATGIAMLNAVLAGGHWSAAFVTGAGAGLTFWHIAGTDPKKS